MNTVLEIIPQTIAGSPFYEAAGEIEYPTSHDDDMGESSLHYALIAYLWTALRFRFHSRADVFVAANMNLYYALGRPELYYTPDVMVIFGVGNHERQVYKLWAEQVIPQVVFEIASARTYKNDLGDKVLAYGELGVEEYYLLDSENFLPLPLMAYRRKNGRLEPVYGAGERVFSPRLGLEIVLTEQGFRLFDPEAQEYLPTFLDVQAEAKIARLQAARVEAEAQAARKQVRELLEKLAKLEKNGA